MRILVHLFPSLLLTNERYLEFLKCFIKSDDYDFRTIVL